MSSRTVHSYRRAAIACGVLAMSAALALAAAPRAQGQGRDPSGAAANPMTAAPAAAAASAADLKRGRLLYIQCRACHELKTGEPHKVGPNLHGFLGRKAAALGDFAYSPALKAANLSWDRATLERWLEKPSAVVPGNSMAFAGISSPTDRAALIAYLEAETK